MFIHRCIILSSFLRGITLVYIACKYIPMLIIVVTYEVYDLCYLNTFVVVFKKFAFNFGLKFARILALIVVGKCSSTKPE